ncbi:MAG: hypothetical protein WAQ22_00530 [Candidatus Saccharimonas sp.]
MNEQDSNIPDIIPGTTVEQPYADFLNNKHEHEVEVARSGVEQALAHAATSENDSSNDHDEIAVSDQEKEATVIDHASYVRQLGEGILLLRQYRQAEMNAEDTRAA